MTEKSASSKSGWVDPDEAPEWADGVWDRAQISKGDRVVRPASGTLTKRGRPPLGATAKQQVTLRLPREVIDHFRAGGRGWQSRIGEALQQYVEKSS